MITPYPSPLTATALPIHDLTAASAILIAVCESTFDLFDCAEIKIKVNTITDFSSATMASPVVTPCTTTCTWQIVDGFQGGVGRDIVQVQAYYKWPLIVVLPYFNLKDQPDNYRLISAVRVWRNEPFS